MRELQHRRNSKPRVVVNDRHKGKRSMLFTTNKPLAAWGSVLHDKDLAQAIVDRHEMSHYSVGTDDHAYDWETTKWNKLTQAQKMDNAESYGNFARDCYSAHNPGK